MKVTLLSKPHIDFSILKGSIEEIVKDLKGIEEIKEIVNDFKIDSRSIYKELRDLKNIQTLAQSFDQGSLKKFNQKLYEIQNNENRLSEIDDTITPIFDKWKELSMILDAIYDIEKGKFLTINYIKDLRNKEIQMAFINQYLAGIVDLKSKVDIVYVRLESLKKAVEHTFTYLEKTYNRISKQILLIQIYHKIDFKTIRT